MTLTGVDPNDPTPMHLFEVTFGAGPGPGAGSEYSVLMFANKTSAGSETVDVLGGPVLSDDDCIARFGRRSEARRMYRKYVAVDPNAPIYIIAVTESAGVAASVDFLFATAATAASTLEITAQNDLIYVPITNGMTVAAIVTAAKDAINAWDGGGLQCVATEGGPGTTVTVTSSQKGPRGSQITGGASTSAGIRMRFLTSCGTTVTKQNSVDGTIEDDATAAFAAAIPGVGSYQWVLPWGHLTSTPTVTDNQIGEAIDNCVTQALPSNGYRFTTHWAFRGTQAQTTTLTTDDQANIARATCWHAENSDWTTAEIAAHMAAVVRSRQMKHPSANLAGHSHDPANGKVLLIPPPYVSTDRPLASEIKADLNNGASPLAWRPNGSPYLVRHVTSRSKNAQGSQDYKAREGHIPRACDFFVETLQAIYQAQLQPFIANDPDKGGKPMPSTTTPGSVKSMIMDLIDDFAGPKPLGIYDGPILAPDKVATMKNAVTVTKRTGGFTTRIELYAVEHLLRSENDVREVGAAY